MTSLPHRLPGRPAPDPACGSRASAPRGRALARAIATALAFASAGVGVPVWQFVLAARLRGDGGRIQAGVYAFGGRLTLRALIDKMVRGEVVVAELRVIEGWTFRQMRRAVAAHPDLTQDAAGLSDGELLRRIDASGWTPGAGWPSPPAWAG